jgi:hypothetical protein
MREMPGKEMKFCRLNRSHPWRQFADTPVACSTSRLKCSPFPSCGLWAVLCSAARPSQEPLRFPPRWILGRQPHLQIPV